MGYECKNRMDAWDVNVRMGFCEWKNRMDAWLFCECNVRTGWMHAYSVNQM